MNRKNALVLLFILFLLAFLHACIQSPAAPTDTAAAANDVTLLAITFDDGPSAATTEALLDGLKERGAHATFFLIGEQIAGQEEIVKRMKQEGHQVGNHTYSHIRLDRAADGGLAELQKEDALLRELLGDDTYWVRPPWGFAGNMVKQNIRVPMVYWSIDTADWQSRNSDMIVRTIVNNVQDGDIILLHDIYPESVDAALRTIDELSAQGYEFVTVQELFARRNVTPQLGQLYARPDTLVTW